MKGKDNRTRYSDEELLEFETLIQKKIEKAQKGSIQADLFEDM